MMIDRRSFLKWVGGATAFLIAPLQVLAVLPRRGPFTLRWRTEELNVGLMLKQFQTINAAEFLGRPAGSMYLQKIDWTKNYHTDKKGWTTFAQWEAKFAPAPKPFQGRTYKIDKDGMHLVKEFTFQIYAHEDHNLLLKDALPGSVKVVKQA